MNDLNELLLAIARCGMEVNLKSSIYADACARIRELEVENERLLSLVCQWSESCTGRHGSQMQCVESLDDHVGVMRPTANDGAEQEAGLSQ